MSENAEENSLSVAQKVRMERNRQRALLLRSARLTSHPYQQQQESSESSSKTVNVGGSRMVDSGGGFFVEEDALHAEVLDAADLVQEPGKSLWWMRISRS